MFPRQPKAPLTQSLWVVVCAGCCGAGWLLSSLHALNRAGYAVTVLLGAAAFGFWWRNSGRAWGVKSVLRGFSKGRRRFRRAVPLTLLGAGGAGVGGRRALCALQLRRAGLPDAARAALAGGGPMALDSHRVPAPEHARLRLRMARRAAARPDPDRPPAVPAELHRVLPVARSVLQQLQANGCSPAGGLVLDVGAAGEVIVFSCKGAAWATTCCPASLCWRLSTTACAPASRDA